MNDAKRWRTVRIADLGRVVTGRTPPSSRPEAFGDVYPFITPSDIPGTTRTISAERYLSPDGARSLSGILLPPLTTCVVCIGATIGKACLTDRTSVANQQINAVIPNTEAHDPHFVYYLLGTLQDALRKQAGGAATPIVNKGAFSEITVHVPPLTEQRQISRILGNYDDLIENSTRRVAIIDAMVRALHRGWGSESVPPCKAGWTTTELGHLVDEIRISVDPREIDPNTPYFGLEHLPRRSIALTTWGTASEVQSSKIRAVPGDILFGKIRPYFHKVGVCPVDAVCSSDILVLRPKTPEYFGLVLTCVSSDSFVAHATQTSQGTKMPRASWQILRRFPVAVPPAERHALLNTHVLEISDFLRHLVLENLNLRTTRNLLLPRLVTGELDVSHLPDPAVDS